MTDPIVPNIVVDQIVDRKLQKLEHGLEKEAMLLDRQEKLRYVFFPLFIFVQSRIVKRTAADGAWKRMEGSSAPARAFPKTYPDISYSKGG